MHRIFLPVFMGLSLLLQSLPSQSEAQPSPVNFGKPVGLQCKKYPKSKCVVAIWNHRRSGTRIVRYSVAFRNSFKKVLEAGIGYNIMKMKACNSEVYAGITNVELTMSFKGTSKTVTATVSEVPTNAPVTSLPSTSSSVSIEGIAALALLIGLFVIFVAYVSLRSNLLHCTRK